MDEKALSALKWLELTTGKLTRLKSAFAHAKLVNTKLAGRLLIALLVFLPLTTHASNTPSVNVAVAANFAKPLRIIADEFTELTGYNVVVSVSSSGTLFAQIQHGAQFDIFMSADHARPQALADTKLVHADNVVNYALGRLAFVYTNHSGGVLNSLNGNSSAADSSENTNSEQAISYKALRNVFNEVMSTHNAKLAVANAKLAPYGVAAEEVIKALNHDYKAGHKPLFSIVKGKNVLQAYQFFTTGSVAGAFVAYSLSSIDNGSAQYGSSVLVPSELHAPIVQALAINEREKAQLSPNVFNALDDAADLDGAVFDNSISPSHLFVQYLLSKHVQQRLPAWGYQAVHLKQHNENTL